MEESQRLKQSQQCSVFWVKFFPFLRWLPMVNRETLRADALAGLTGAIIVLPQAWPSPPSPACPPSTASTPPWYRR